MPRIHQVVIRMSTVRRRTKSGSREDFQLDSIQAGYGYSITGGTETFVEAQGILDPIDMSCRDRTGEFLSAVKSLQSSSSGKVTMIHFLNSKIYIVPISPLPVCFSFRYLIENFQCISGKWL